MSGRAPRNGLSDPGVMGGHAARTGGASVALSARPRTRQRAAPRVGAAGSHPEAGFHYEVIVIGASWGGLEALSLLLEGLHEDVEQPMVVAQHRASDADEEVLAHLLQQHTRRIVSGPDDKTPLEPRHVYIGPPDYHLLLEHGHLALSLDEPVQHARPSVDVLFESAADAYGERVVGVVLTGANADGAVGLARIKERGGVAIVQDPETSERRAMPDAAIAATAADAILPLEEIPKFLYGLCGTPHD